MEFIEHKLFSGVKRAEKRSETEKGWKGCLKLYKRLKECWVEFKENSELNFGYCMVDRVLKILQGE